jgi:ADP-heptose:LPS heptosyltransferase
VLDATPGLLVPALQDFADTAALLSQLDLLITVDVSVAHLAGAPGIPLWLMLRFSPDYRWLLGRSDSPWYPTLWLYRQPCPGDWDAVIAAVRRDLSGLR